MRAGPQQLSAASSAANPIMHRSQDVTEQSWSHFKPSEGEEQVDAPVKAHTMFILCSSCNKPTIHTSPVKHILMTTFKNSPRLPSTSLVTWCQYQVGAAFIPHGTDSKFLTEVDHRVAADLLAAFMMPSEHRSHI